MKFPTTLLLLIPLLFLPGCGGDKAAQDGPIDPMKDKGVGPIKNVTLGPIDDALTEATLSECFDMPLSLERRADGRLSAWARR